jgi:hypothetical protein
MAIEINMTPEDIERLVKDSILRSGFGAAIEKAITGAFTGYNNPIEAKLKEFVGVVAGEMISEHFGDKIREAVKVHIEKMVTDEVVEKTTSAAVQKMVRAAEESRY